jgi:hypothetical protein
MARKPDWIPDRKAFPKAVRVAVLKRSGGMCELPGCGAVGAEFDHYPKPVAFGGESVLENCRLLCRPHNADLGVETAAQAAEADRKGGRTGQYARQQRRKEKGVKSKFQSRGFSKTHRKKLNGTVERIYPSDEV